jgi:hypothetical protein
MYQWRAELLLQESGPRTRGQLRRVGRALRRLNLELVTSYALGPDWLMHSGRLLQHDLLLINPLGHQCKVASESTSNLNKLVIN